MRPLEGVTVIDFTQAFSGPYGTVNLADYGARVIKIERTGVGDQSRDWLPYNKEGKSGYFALYNRNKESLTVDLAQEKGREIIRKLVANADIVVDNFKTGTLEKLHLGYEELKKINPQIIMASLNGYGQYGSLKHLAAYDNIIEGTCGLMDCSGFPNGEPVRNGCSIGDSYTGLMTAFAISMAYYHKIKTGEGQRIDVAMQDSLFACLEGAFLEYSLHNRKLPRTGNNLSNLVAPYDVFECKDGWFSIATATESGWQELCRDVNMPELINDPRFRTNSLRCQHNTELTEILKPFFKERTKKELKQRFTCKYMGASPVMNAMDTIADTHMLSRSMVVEIEDSYLGTYKTVGIPIKFEKTPGSIEKGSPKLGEHNSGILKELNYTDDEVKNLIEEGVID